MEKYVFFLKSDGKTDKQEFSLTVDEKKEFSLQSDAKTRFFFKERQ